MPGRGAVELGKLGIGTQIVTRAGPTLIIASLVRHDYPSGIMKRACGTNVRSGPGGRKVYWDDETGTAVVHNPHDPDLGTAFLPDTGKAWLDDKYPE